MTSHYPYPSILLVACLPTLRSLNAFCIPLEGQEQVGLRNWEVEEGIAPSPCILGDKKEAAFPHLLVLT